MPSKILELRRKVSGSFNHGDSLSYVRTNWSGIDGKPSVYPPAGHTHLISQVTGLVDTLNGKAESSHNHDASNITSGTISNSRLPSTFVNLTDGQSNLPYKSSIIIYGDSDKYYPVHFAKGNQDLLRTIKIWRGYNLQAPSDWYSPTHKGSLNLEWKGNYGGWGGAVYNQWIYENTSSYTTLLAETQLVDNSYAVAFFLRGGGTTGALYHFASDQPLTWTDSNLTYTKPTAFYSQEKTFDHANNDYVKYAPAPRTTVNTSQLNSITVVKGNDSRLTNARPASDVPSWAKSSQSAAANRFLTVNNNTASWRTDVQMKSDLGLATVATSGSYADLSNKPTIPTIPGVMPVQEGDDGTSTTVRTINALNLRQIVEGLSPPGSRPASDVSAWAKAANKPSYAWSEIGSKPSVIIEGDARLTNSRPASDVPSWAKSSQSAAANRFLTVNNNTASWRTDVQMKSDLGLATVATSGSYADLSNKPSWIGSSKPTYSYSEIGGLQDQLNGKVTYKGLLGTTDLNTLNTEAAQGIYSQNANANATLARNYPTASSGAGLLRVYWTGANSGVVQEYNNYMDGRIYVRAYQGSSWSGWSTIADRDWVTSNTRSSSWVPSWSQVSGKPSWIGSSKPSYTYSDVGAAAASHTHNYAGSSSAGGSANSLLNFTTTTTTSLGVDAGTSGIGYISVPLLGQSDGALYTHVYSSSWKHQIYGDYRTGQIAIRGKNNGTWQGWRTVVDSSNIGTYVTSSVITTGLGYTPITASQARSNTWTPTWAQVTSKPENLIKQVSFNGSSMVIEVI